MGGGVHVLISWNDYESDFIVRLLKLNGYPCTALKRRWGVDAPLSREEMAALNGAETILLAEFGSDAVVAQLTAANHRVEILDHHLFARPGEMVDRRNELSVLEQLVLRLDLAYDRDADPEDLDGLSQEVGKLVSANDRGFFPALIEAIKTQHPEKEKNAGWVMARAHAVRRRDLALNAQHRNDEAVRAEVESAIEEARAAIASADGRRRPALFNAFASVGDHTGPMDDRIIVCCADEAHRQTYLDALYRWAIDEGIWAPGDPMMNVVALFFGLDRPGRKTLRRVLFSGSATYRQMATELVAQASTEPAFGRLRVFAGGSEGVFLEAVDLVEDAEAQLSAFADAVLRNCLIGVRPLSAYRTHFSQTFRLKGRAAVRKLQISGENLTAPYKAYYDGGETGPADKARLDQESAYFYDHVSEFLVPEARKNAGSRRVACDIRDGLAARSGRCRLYSARFSLDRFSIRVTDHEREDLILEFPIEEVGLYFLFDGAIAVEWTVAAQRPALSADPQDERPVPFWERVLAVHEAGGYPSLAEALHFNAIARFATSTYSAPSTAYTIELVVNGKSKGSLAYGGVVSSPGSVDGWLEPLLGAILKNVGLAPADVEMTGTSRVRVHSSAALFGTAPSTVWARSRMRVLLARFCTVEPYGSEHFYNPPFALRELSKGLYDRFGGGATPTWYAATAHSFVGLMFDGEGPDAGFAVNVLHGTHMRGVYRRMWILITLYEALLKQYALEIGGNTTSPSTMNEVRARFMVFSNRLWFESISTEVQGQELFALMRQQTCLTREHELITQELQLSDEFFAQRHERKMSRFANKLAGVAFGLGAVAVIEPLLPTAPDIALFTPDWFVRLFWVAAVPIAIGFGAMSLIKALSDDDDAGRNR